MAGIDTMVSQGMMQPTSRNLDAAIDGDGYFMVGTGEIPANNGAGVGINNGKITKSDNMAVQYTRDGSFTLDEQGNLLTSDGSRVLGYALVQTIPTTPPTITNSIDYSTNGSLNFVDLNDGVNKPVASDTLVPLKVPDSVIKNGKEMRIRTFSIGKDGVISAVLEDGSVSGLGQIAMASFKNPAGLSKVGKNLYDRSANSGEPIVRSGLNAATDNSKGYGDMLQGMLEMSNVDLAEQFTDMIVTSRAFQANSKTITTGDEILQDILNLKR